MKVTGIGDEEIFISSAVVGVLNGQAQKTPLATEFFSWHFSVA
jgi:hypothetical protein